MRTSKVPTKAPNNAKRLDPISCRKAGVFIDT
jgi:hypothetical protein